MEEVKQNVVSIGIGVIPKMDLVTTTTKKKNFQNRMSFIGSWLTTLL